MPLTSAQKQIASVRHEEESLVLKEDGAVLPVIEIKQDDMKDETYLKKVRKYAFRPAWMKNAVLTEVPENKPTVTVIIDDMGVNRAQSLAAIQLPAPLTLSFLPYANGVGPLAERARYAGHELMVHMPMQPVNPELDTGPIVLRKEQTSFEFEQMIDKALSAIHGYVGMNNHMGSSLTQSEEHMELLMAILNGRGLLFVDSRTIHTSVAAEAAALFDVPYAVRDVFIDHDPAPEKIRESLKKLEDIAREHGSAVGIGHPKEATIEALSEWLPSLEEKGIALVPVSHVVITRSGASYSSLQDLRHDPLHQ